MIKEEVTILSKYISGVIHPLLMMDCIIKIEDAQIIVLADGVEKKINVVNRNRRGRIIFSVKLTKEEEKIEVYLKKDKEQIRLCKMHNSMINRIKYKIKEIFIKIFKPFKMIGKSIKYLWTEHHFLIPPFLWKEYFKRFIHKIKVAFRLEYYNPFRQKDYLKWIEKNEEKPVYEKLSYEPLISVLIPVYNISRLYLSECLDSILNGHYQNFEICIADDCSTLEETKETLKEYEAKDKRIRVVYRKENGHISRATNDALSIAKGEFVALMDNDDIITENALYEMVYALNQNKDLDLIYSDEDKLDMQGRRCEPHFKADYSPDSLLGGNYICHFEILRREIMNEIGGFKPEFVGAQDFDLFLRFTEKTTPDRIYHIPKILYHWRKIPGSTADTIENKEYAILNGQKAVIEALKRRGLKGDVLLPIQTTQYVVNYKYSKEPKISIIIPTRDLTLMLKNCLVSIYQKTKYKNYEVIVVNNDSKDEETYELFKLFKKEYSNFKVIDVPGEFNYSKINNLAVKEAKGEYLLFLNNDTEVYTDDWLDIMVGYAMQEHIGAVGVKLLYPDDTIQHGGVILGMGGSAGHAFMHEDGCSYGFYGRLLVPYDYSAVTAACMMVSKEKFNKVQGFDEELKVAFNDVDFNLKLRELGYYNVFLPQVELCHYESVTRGLDITKEKRKILLKEISILQKRWGSIINNDPFYNINLSRKKSFMLDRVKKDKQDESNKKNK